MIHANGAVLPGAAQAGLLVPDGRPHVDLIAGDRNERAARADVHALQSLANGAGGSVGVDEGSPVATPAAAVDHNAVDGAGDYAMPAPAAGLAKSDLGQGPRGTQPELERHAARGGAEQVLFQPPKLLGHPLQRRRHRRQRPQRLGDPQAEEVPAADGFFRFVGHESDQLYSANELG